MIFDSITSCDINLRKALASSIYLSGGTTMTPGLSSRLEKELKNLWVTKVGNGNADILNRVKI